MLTVKAFTFKCIRKTDENKNCLLALCNLAGLFNKLLVDITIASLHIPCMSPGTEIENTKAYVNAIKNPLINIVGHPDDRRYPVNYREVVQAAKDYHTLIELNNASLTEGGARINARPLDIEILGLCAEYNVPIVIGSDAHIDLAVGNHDKAAALLEEINFPEHLIVNQDVDYLKQYVNRYKF